MVNYLRGISRTFVDVILGGRKDLMASVDAPTVKALELRVPGRSVTDMDVLEKLFRTGQLFPLIRNNTDRQQIWQNIRRVDKLITTLYTFFEDVKYIEEPARILWQLLPPTEDKQSLRTRMSAIFSTSLLRDGHCFIQESEDQYREVRGSSADQLELGYRHLWLMAWRECFDMRPVCPKKERGQNTPVPRQPDLSKWSKIARLGKKVGFESEEINRLLSVDHVREDIQEYLTTRYDPRYFIYDEEHCVSGLTEILRSIKAKPSSPRKPLLFVPGCGESLERRCGRTFENAHEYDRHHLFLDNLHELDNESGSGISSFFVRASVYHAFFGDYCIPTRTNMAPTPNPRDPAHLAAHSQPEPHEQLQPQEPNRSAQEHCQPLNRPEAGETVRNNHMPFSNILIYRL
jgi:hypothetical protein